jgi:hypothetical protein
LSRFRTGDGDNIVAPGGGGPERVNGSEGDNSSLVEKGRQNRSGLKVLSVAEREPSRSFGGIDHNLVITSQNIFVCKFLYYWISYALLVLVLVLGWKTRSPRLLWNDLLLTISGDPPLC